MAAALCERNSLHDIITKTADEIFIPLTVGGGLRNIGDIRDVLRAGADKVALNTAAVKNPPFIREASKQFGASTIIISIEATRQPDGQYQAYTDNGRNATGLEVLAWAKRVEELGAGEIMLTSVDREGTGSGYDIELTRTVAKAVSIPVIACGGAGCKEDIREVITEGKADAVSFASILHYEYINRHKTTFSDYVEGNTEFLSKGKRFSMIEPEGLPQIKAFLRDRKISCRWSVTSREG